MCSQEKILGIEIVGLESARVETIQLQEVALRTHIGEVQRHGVGHLLLNAEAPVFEFRGTAAEVRIVVSHG